jgi:hypothetical protein
VKLKLDENLHGRLVADLSALGHDVDTVSTFQTCVCTHPENTQGYW